MRGEVRAGRRPHLNMKLESSHVMSQLCRSGRSEMGPMACSSRNWRRFVSKILRMTNSKSR